jgi:RecB family exonuclease
MSEPEHISVTQLKMYLRCPLQYFFRYGCGLKVQPTGDMLLGRTVHQAIKDNYRQKLQSYEDLPLSDMTDIFDYHWEQETKEAEFPLDEDSGKLKDQGIGMIKAYHETVSPTIQPLEVEREFLIENGNNMLPLKGYIDLIDDKGTIIDHKTSKKSYPPDSAQKDLQLTAYALAYRQLYGEEENGVRLDVMVRNKQPKIQQLSGKRSDSDIKRFQRISGNVLRGIREGVYYPNEGYMCGICGYGEMCKEW